MLLVLWKSKTVGETILRMASYRKIFFKIPVDSLLNNRSSEIVLSNSKYKKEFGIVYLGVFCIWMGIKIRMVRVLGRNRGWRKQKGYTGISGKINKKKSQICHIKAEITLPLSKDKSITNLFLDLIGFYSQFMNWGSLDSPK